MTLLAVGAVSSFVPNSCSNNHKLCSGELLPASGTACFASNVDAESTSSIVFPFNDAQVRFAYDEWRLVYGKGDFDAVRFENFKTNHKTLTISNLKARKKAARDGRPVPQWMSLNEYGDYSLDEYEAMLRGETQRENILQQGQNLASKLMNGDFSMDYNNGQAEETQDQFGRTIRSTQALKIDDSSPQAVSSSQSWEVNQNYANNINNAGARDVRGTIRIPKGEDKENQISQRGTQVISSGNGNGPASSAVRGTQVIQPSGGANSGATGTRVVQKTPGNGSSASYGTQVIGGNNGNNVRGTQVLSSAKGQSSPSPSIGTQVIQPGNPGSNGNGNDARGTQVLQSFSDADTNVDGSSFGTQIIPKGKGDVGSSDASGTIVLSKGSDKTEETWGDIFAKIFADPKESKTEDDEDDSALGSRGTLVIKRTIEDPEPQRKSLNLLDIFGSGSEDKAKEEVAEAESIVEEEKTPKNKNFFGFLSPKQNSTVKEETMAATEEEKEDAEEKPPGGGIFSLFGGNVKSSGSRPVRTTISLQKKEKKSSPAPKARETKLIPEEENENGKPSILSFFGGAKKVDEEEAKRDADSGRPTLIVKKPQKYKNQLWSPFSQKKSVLSSSTASTSASTTDEVTAARIAKQRELKEKAQQKKAEVATEREAKRLEREQKRLEATKKREALARKPVGSGTQEISPKAAAASSATQNPFQFFGAIGRQPSTPPTMKKWRQNRDGTITGLIYESKNFKDGTRITTSPVSRGAKKGTTVQTGGGSKYSLD